MTGRPTPPGGGRSEPARPVLRRGARSCATRPRRSVGVILLEMVLALTVFAATAGVVLATLRSTAGAARQMELRNEGANLAVTVLSLIEAGRIEPLDEGPTPLDVEDERFADEFYVAPAPDWTWQVTTAEVVGSLEGVTMLDVEVTVRHEPSGFAYRLRQWLPAAAGEGDPEYRQFGDPDGTGPFGRAAR